MTRPTCLKFRVLLTRRAFHLSASHQPLPAPHGLQLCADQRHEDGSDRELLVALFRHSNSRQKVPRRTEAQKISLPEQNHWNLTQKAIAFAPYCYDRPVSLGHPTILFFYNYNHIYSLIVDLIFKSTRERLVTSKFFERIADE
jgi:hypothetical protein